MNIFTICQGDNKRNEPHGIRPVLIHNKGGVRVVLETLAHLLSVPIQRMRDSGISTRGLE